MLLPCGIGLLLCSASPARHGGGFAVSMSLLTGGCRVRQAVRRHVRHVQHGAITRLGRPAAGAGRADPALRQRGLPTPFLTVRQRRQDWCFFLHRHLLDPWASIDNRALPASFRSPRVRHAGPSPPPVRQLDEARHDRRAKRLDLRVREVRRSLMLPHTRALIAASAHAFITGKKVAGVYDHAAGRHLRIAAEGRGAHLQGFDGDRSARFGGTLPELYDAADKAFVSLEVDGATALGHDRGSDTSYEAKVTENVVQLYDHGRSTWFAFDIQVA
jgi:hypothetical protein